MRPSATRLMAMPVMTTFLPVASSLAKGPGLRPADREASGNAIPLCKGLFDGNDKVQKCGVEEVHHLAHPGRVRCPPRPGRAVDVIWGHPARSAGRAGRPRGPPRSIAAPLPRCPACVANHPQYMDRHPGTTHQLGALASAFTAHGGAGGYDVVVDYVWGRPREVLLDALANHTLESRSSRTRLVQVGEAAGPRVGLSASVLRSTGLEIMGMGTGNVPPAEMLRSAIDHQLQLLASGGLRVDMERLPLSSVATVWVRDQAGRRPVFIP
jgi:hypothetical protein